MGSGRVATGQHVVIQAISLSSGTGDRLVYLNPKSMQNHGLPDFYCVSMERLRFTRDRRYGSFYGKSEGLQDVFGLR